MLYVNESYTKQATSMPRMNDPFWNETKMMLFGTKQEQCFLEHNKKDSFYNET